MHAGARAHLCAAKDGGRPGLELAQLIEQAARVDGRAPFGEHVLVTVSGAGQVEHVRLASRVAGQLAGYLVLSQNAGVAWYADMVTAPAHRGRGVATGLLRAAADHVADNGGGCLRTWAYTHGAPDVLADRLAMTVCREVAYQQRPLAGPVDCPPVVGTRIRTLRHEEASAWLELSNAAFTGHPENGGWKAHDLAWRLAAPWTDLSRFVVAVDAHTDELLAGVWTKVEPGSTDGELYVVAVRPESVNAKIRLIQVRAFGFHNPFALIALAKLTLSGLCPPLPGRAIA